MDSKYFLKGYSNPRATRKRLVASRSVASVFWGEQQKHSMTFFGKGGTVERVTDFLWNKKSERA